MAVIILPDAQDDLHALQDYMRRQWNDDLWLRAEQEIYDQLARVESGVLRGAVVHELADVGIKDYLCVLTSHHRLVFRWFEGDCRVYAMVGQQQDFAGLLFRRLLRR